MSLNIALLIRAIGTNAAAALEDIQVFRPYWHNQDSNQDGVVAVEIWGMSPSEWRPTLDEIATKHNVILVIESRLTEPSEWEEEQGMGEYDSWRFGPSKAVLNAYERMLDAFTALMHVAVVRKTDRDAAAVFLTSLQREWLLPALKD